VEAVLTSAPQCTALAARELRDVLPAGAALEALAPGVWLASTSGSFTDLARGLQATVFVRHACPAQLEVAVPDGAELRAWAAALVPALLALLRRGAGQQALQVQARLLPGGPAWAPGGLAAAAAAGLREAGQAVTGGPAPTVLSLVVAAGRAWAGCGPASAQLSPWPGGVARLRARPGELARSARKLEEALELFGLQPAAGSRVLELGAAPGGWTRLLLDLGLQVTAIDTALLHPSLEGAPGLNFIRGNAASVPVPPGPFGLLAADLSWDPLRAADCVLRCAGALAAGASGVFTIKFFGGDPLDLVSRVRRRLEAGGLEVPAVRHLFHDRAEATALLRAGARPRG